MSHEGPPQFNKTPSSEGKLSTDKKAAMMLSAKIGKQIQKTFRDIATDYRNGLTLPELVVKYNIVETFGITNTGIAIRAVQNALNGYKGRSGDSYPGLIEDSNIARAIGNQHKKDSGKKKGELARDTRSGIFGMTEEQMKEVRTMGGASLFRAKKGIHAQTIEERREAGKAGVTSKGFIPLSDAEETFIRNLDLNSDQYRTRRTRVDTTKIAQELNARFHKGDNVRKANAISSFLSRIKNRNASKIES